VKTLVDARLRDQARRFALRFACEDCAHFDGSQCSLAYPASPRREALEEGTATIDGTPEGSRPATIEFCKAFEIA
jgi:hypothetical protein